MSKLNIVISGYGKMGREVEKVARRKNHNIVAKLDNEEDWKQFIRSHTKADVVIDFSVPRAAVELFLRCFELNIPLVTGTTGWYDRKDEILQVCKKMNATFFYAPNFSIGTNLFFYTNKKLAEVMNRVDGYDVSITETHHIHKLDAPSGTAIQVANEIIGEMDRLNGWLLEKKQDDKIPVKSIRQGEVTGIHEVVWKSDADEIVLKHEAKNRTGFAQGAVLAAEFIQEKKGIFTMKELLDLNY